MSQRRPFRASQTVSVPVGSVATPLSIAVPAFKRLYLKQINLTKGANTTLSNQKIDGVSTGQAASYDVAAVFGGVIDAESSVEVTGSNAGTAAENLTMEVIGYAEDR